jgi:hypothetical protein
MKFINANNLHRKSVGMGHPSFVRGLIALWQRKGYVDTA